MVALGPSSTHWANAYSAEDSSDTRSYFEELTFAAMGFKLLNCWAIAKRATFREYYAIKFAIKHSKYFKDSEVAAKFSWSIPFNANEKVAVGANSFSSLSCLAKIAGHTSNFSRACCY